MTATTLDLLLEFVALTADNCERHGRFATISLFIVPDAVPFVTVLDAPCTDPRFLTSMQEAAEHCDMHRTSSTRSGYLWEYRYTPLPEVADLYGHE